MMSSCSTSGRRATGGTREAHCDPTTNGNTIPWSRARGQVWLQPLRHIRNRRDSGISGNSLSTGSASSSSYHCSLTPKVSISDVVNARQRSYLSAHALPTSGRRSRGNPARYSVITPESSAAVGEVEGPERAAILSARRVRRLEILVQLRKLYRNLIRGDALLSEAAPIYKAGEIFTVANGVPLTEEEVAELAKRHIDDAVATVAEMQLTAEQLKSSLRKLSIGGFSNVFGGEDPHAAVTQVSERVAEMAEMLARRVSSEIDSLPFTERSVAQAALDARNARFRSASTKSMNEDDVEDAWDRQRNAAIERLEQAEKVAERIVSKNIPEAVQKVRELPPGDLVAGVKRSGAYARGVWLRLNGGGGTGLSDGLPLELPKPVSSKEERQKYVQGLQMEVDQLEGKVQEASKVRETRLRKVGAPGRARMASELREMDQDILVLTRALAVASLQLEMEAIYSSLEEEALEIAADANSSSLRRAGTSDETALLAAEFALLDEGLAALRVAIDRGQAALIGEQELDHLAMEIPDMRSRLGIRDVQVFGGSGLTMMKMQLTFKESIAKIEEGIKFFARGIRLFGSDIGNSGRLVMFAVTGGTLKQREVVGLKRTVLDITTFFPFAIILIAPLTPVGHVLIFGFIQRYFPNLFPSQFTERRQALMSKYDQLRPELSEAQELASAEEQRRVIDSATQAISMLGQALNPAGLSSPRRVVQLISDPSQASSDASAAGRWSDASGESSDDEGPAARAVRELERQLDAAEKDALRSVDYSSDEGDRKQSVSKNQSHEA